MITTYNITYNAQYDSHEVTFESKPATAVLDALKALKMRWNPKKACWYGFAKEHEIINAILENGEGETITGEKTEGATVYTDGYLGGGAVYGSKSNLHLYGADLSKAIREDIKRAGIKGVSVRCKSYSGGQSISVTVTLRPDEYISFPEFLENYRVSCGDHWVYTKENPHGITTEHYFYNLTAEEQEETRRAAAEYEYEKLVTKEARVNQYYFDDCTQFTPETLAKIKKIRAIVCAYRYDESNSQVDYFDTNFYYDIYTKPAAVKPTTPDDEPTKPEKEELKEKPAAEEIAPVQSAEQLQESAEAPETADYTALIEDIRSDLSNAGIICTGATVTDGAPATIHFNIVCGESDDTFFRACSIIEYHQTSDDFAFYAYPVNFWYDVRPCQPLEPAETIPESAVDTPEEAPETAGFHPIINNLPKKSKWDVWNVRPDEYLSSCVVPLVRCDENYHVLDTVYLKVDTPEEVKTLMSAAAVGNRRRWPKYNKQYRRETVQRAADIIEKYYI